MCVDKNQTHLDIKAAKVLNWRLNGFFLELSKIENGLFIVEYDEMPISTDSERAHK